MFNTRLIRGQVLSDDIRERLILAAARLLRECSGKCEITVRGIAAEADASPGLVNYHFGSKDALLAAAAERIWKELDFKWDEVAASPDFPTLVARLKAVLKEVADAVMLNRPGAEVMVRNELLESDFPTTRYMVRVLRKALPPSIGDTEIKRASWFIVAPLQLMLLRAEAFEELADIDPDDKSERDAVFDYIVDRILAPLAGKVGTESGRGHTKESAR